VQTISSTAPGDQLMSGGPFQGFGTSVYVPPVKQQAEVDPNKAPSLNGTNTNGTALNGTRKIGQGTGGQKTILSGSASGSVSGSPSASQSKPGVSSSSTGASASTRATPSGTGASTSSTGPASSSSTEVVHKGQTESVSAVQSGYSNGVVSTTGAPPTASLTSTYPLPPKKEKEIGDDLEKHLPKQSEKETNQVATPDPFETPASETPKGNQPNHQPVGTGYVQPPVRKVVEDTAAPAMGVDCGNDCTADSLPLPEEIHHKEPCEESCASKSHCGLSNSNSTATASSSSCNCEKVSPCEKCDCRKTCACGEKSDACSECHSNCPCKSSSDRLSSITSPTSTSTVYAVNIDHDVKETAAPAKNSSFPATPLSKKGSASKAPAAPKSEEAKPKTEKVKETVLKPTSSTVRLENASPAANSLNPTAAPKKLAGKVYVPDYFAQNVVVA